MRKIIIPAKKSIEMWDEVKEEYFWTPAEKEETLLLEHSLISISKWESKWCVPFLSKKEKTAEETIDYIRCMTVSANTDQRLYDRLTIDNIRQIEEYINAPMTATILPKRQTKGSKEIVTSELIYYWMISMNIPIECEKWHINRLLALIGICEIKNEPPKKISRREATNHYAALNAARRKQLNSKG